MCCHTKIRKFCNIKMKSFAWLWNDCYVLHNTTVPLSQPQSREMHWLIWREKYCNNNNYSTIVKIKINPIIYFPFHGLWEASLYQLVVHTHRQTDIFLLLNNNIKTLFLKIVYELPYTFSLGQKQIANEKNAEKKTELWTLSSD